MKSISLFIIHLCTLMLWVSCTKDRLLPEPTLPDSGDAGLIHYWNFNENGNFDRLINPSFSMGSPSLTFIGFGADDVNDGSLINARNNDEAGRALRLRNPSEEFILRLPTVGFRDVRLSFATMRTNNGPLEQTIFYSSDGVNFIQAGLNEKVIATPLEWGLFEFDFSAVPSANNNSSFTIKFVYSGGASNTAGNTRYDNIVLEGVKL